MIITCLFFNEEQSYNQHEICCPRPRTFWYSMFIKSTPNLVLFFHHGSVCSQSTLHQPTVSTSRKHVAHHLDWSQKSTNSSLMLFTVSPCTDCVGCNVDTQNWSIQLVRNISYLYAVIKHSFYMSDRSFRTLICAPTGSLAMLTCLLRYKTSLRIFWYVIVCSYVLFLLHSKISENTSVKLFI